MPFDPVLADRIRALLADEAHLTEKKMFGGIGWMIGGNMAAGAHSDGRLMIRCSKEDYGELLDQPGAGGMPHGGKMPVGWILVDAATVADPDVLATWVGRGRDHAASLPRK